jgi:hypothetical protein
MKKVHCRVLGVFFSLAVMAGAASAAGDLWLHVKVDEGDGAKVTVNLPVSIIEKAIPMLPVHDLHHARIANGEMNVEFEDIRELWQEVRDSPDMTFVTAEDDTEKVRVWKKSNWVYVEVRDEEGPESVDVKVPLAVVDALLAGDEIDIEGAVRALVEHGEGEFVTVSDRDDNVRVWVDDTPEAN